MKIGHYQCASVAGDYKVNLETLIEGLELAQNEGVKIVCFPESLLTGYFDSEEKARKFSMRIDGPEISKLLKLTAGFNSTFMVGFNEIRGDNLFNSVMVAEKGRLLGVYSKAFPCYDYFTPGRKFPVFEREGLKFGIVICADGGYIEPTRILALQGAQVVFAPHYNYIRPEYVVNHSRRVKNDHIARAVENNIWFLRGNNVVFGQDSGLSYTGIGYGESYLLDPNGEVVIQSRRHVENFIYANIDLSHPYNNTGRSRVSASALSTIISKLADADTEVDNHR